MNNTKEHKKDFKVLVLGAGMSGILAGIKLKEAGIHNFDIIEMADDVGGTWRANTYPGLACDVPAHNYDYSFEHNWNWSGLYATGPELFAYFKFCAEKYGIRPHLQLNTRVDMIARKDGKWVVSTNDGQDRVCDIVINCMGVLCHPQMPNIEGIDSFEGDLFHSARWDHSVPLDNKRIGLIGTGSTAAQIASALAERSKHFSLFQRTAQWVIPAFHYHRSGLSKTLHRKLPKYSAFTGQLQGKLIEMIGKAVSGDSPRTYALIKKLCERHLKTIRDPELRKTMTPNFEVGCRRLIFSDNFYNAIQAPQSEVVTEGIERIEAKGIRTKDGRLHELDVLVMATGFHALSYTYGFDIINEQGVKLSEEWAEGSEALRGCAVSGFPNFFMLIGPRSPIGNFSLTSISESQMNYIMPLIKMLSKGEAKEIDVNAEAQQRYSEWMDQGVEKTVWASGCTSWYLGKNGKPQLYPYTPVSFRSALKKPDMDEFVVS
ncbi:NAD(P)/FAD-dependent oxidoreductase [Spongiibacter sp. KMU-158]|uniref:NAD(P)/FAD-dependent oxidoreductase n=1 Tax=Spongiibacter pelagi TaxID=2760804 RepID=A0A927C417_9GAMM|nr:NAD(P)/FAD-dependent oxidoreductase [Spongiibacter pelagi]MBD2859452.1 NAD(P)/FAD-dependent oxidoreductase [Spongiibacter pelagi]